jgi:hypothetical protein
MGSPVTAETIGTVEVASRRARAVVDVVERMASGASATNSAAEVRTRSPSSATRVAIRSLACVQPSSCSRFLKVTRLGSVSAKVARTPMARTRSVVCARAIAGQTAALPTNVMNSRRLIVALKPQDRALHPFKLAHRKGATDVRFGSLADICNAKRHVALPKSGHVQRNSACPLCAMCGRLRVGNFTFAALVGAAMCSAC